MFGIDSRRWDEIVASTTSSPLASRSGQALLVQ
jgi:hypothetical protein